MGPLLLTWMHRYPCVPNRAEKITYRTARMDVKGHTKNRDIYGETRRGREEKLRSQGNLRHERRFFMYSHRGCDPMFGCCSHIEFPQMKPSASEAFRSCLIRPRYGNIPAGAQASLSRLCLLNGPLARGCFRDPSPARASPKLSIEYRDIGSHQRQCFDWLDPCHLTAEQMYGMSSNSNAEFK